MSVSSKRKSKQSPRETQPKISQRKDEAEQQPIEIFLRIRPQSKNEIENRESIIVKVQNDNIIAVRPPESSLAHKNGDYQEHRFTFSKVLDENVSQDTFYSQTVQKEVEDLYKNGKNSLIVAYGCSGTGKSHTIHGSKNEPGLMDHIFTDLFGQIHTYKDQIENQTSSDIIAQDHMVFLSYIEIYNERIYDLLSSPPTADSTRKRTTTEARKPLKLKFDKQMKPCVDGICEVPIRDMNHAREILQTGNLARQSASTAVNQISSRSHALLTIKLVSMPKGLTKKKLIKNPEKYLQLRKLTVVDMAGNERSKRTLASGARMKEASNINQSLMTFRNCIEALKANQQASRPSIAQHVVPFRDSKLTTLLKEFLVGNGKTTMIVCASPCGIDYDETIHSLKFSSIAKEVRTVQAPNTPKRQMKPKASSTKTPQEVRQLQKQLQESQQYCAELESRLRRELTEEFAERLAFLEEQFKIEHNQESIDIQKQAELLHKSEMDIITQMNELYQTQVRDIFDHPEQFVSIESSPKSLEDNKRLKQLEEENCKLTARHKELDEERKALTKQLESEKNRLILLQIRANNNSIENDQLQERVVSLENRIKQLQNSKLHDDSQTDMRDLAQQLQNSKQAQKDLTQKLEQLDEDNKVLKDQIDDLNNIIKHHRKEQKAMQTQPLTPSRATPSRIDKVKNLLTPKSKTSKHIPTTLIHNDSSGNLQTWQGKANPSLTGDGVSVQFNQIQNLQSFTASTFFHEGPKNDIDEQETLPHNVISSPTQVLMNSSVRPDYGTLGAVMIPLSSPDLSDAEFAEKFENSAFKKSSSSVKKTPKSSKKENVENRKRGRISTDSDFGDIPLEELNPKKKTKLNGRHVANKTKTRVSKRTKTGTRVPSSRIR